MINVLINSIRLTLFVNNLRNVTCYPDILLVFVPSVLNKYYFLKIQKRKWPNKNLVSQIPPTISLSFRVRFKSGLNKLENLNRILFTRILDECAMYRNPYWTNFPKSEKDGFQNQMWLGDVYAHSGQPSVSVMINILHSNLQEASMHMASALMVNLCAAT